MFSVFLQQKIVNLKKIILFPKQKNIAVTQNFHWVQSEKNLNLQKIDQVHKILQDLGFTLDESETKLGLLTASKDREAGSAGEKIGVFVLAVLFGTPMIYDTNQKIYVTLVSTKSHNGDGYNVRIEFARIIWDSAKNARIEKIQDKEIYKDFFDKLSQSVFLTANNI